MTRETLVIDTSSVLHNHEVLVHFRNADIVVPIFVLAELDRHKTGQESSAFNARRFLANLDRFSKNRSITKWARFPKPYEGRFIVFDDSSMVQGNMQEETKDSGRFMNALEHFRNTNPKLVSVDSSLRAIARARGFQVASFMNENTAVDTAMYTGRNTLDDLPHSLITKFYADKSVPFDQFGFKDGPSTQGFYILNNGTSKSGLGFANINTQCIEHVEKLNVSGIQPLNSEQAFALHALMHPTIELVSLQGIAGTGKTLLAIAAAVAQSDAFDQILLARPIVALSNSDIGFLPGEKEDKIRPYMEPFYDNLRFIKEVIGDKGRKYIDKLLEDKKMNIMPLAFIRGRSLNKTLIIVDESQNLTPHEVKTVISRAGKGSKVILTGDVFQIDTPYLDHRNNGLAYVVQNVMALGNVFSHLAAHVTLEKGVRSELANLANEVL